MQTIKYFCVVLMFMFSPLIICSSSFSQSAEDIYGYWESVELFSNGTNKLLHITKDMAKEDKEYAEPGDHEIKLKNGAFVISSTLKRFSAFPSRSEYRIVDKDTITREFGKTVTFKRITKKKYEEELSHRN